MMNLINAIPEEIGWVLVGIAGCVCAILMYKLAKLIVEMWREWHEEEAEEEM